MTNKEMVRSRTVIFRLSPEEYERLQSACSAANGRNLSEHLRKLVLGTVEHGALSQRLQDLELKLSATHELVKRLLDSVDLPPTPRDGASRADTTATHRGEQFVGPV